MDTPDWLTSDYLAESLQLFYGDNALELLEFLIKPALGKGENFGGILTRLSVKYVTKGVHYRKSLVVKTSFEGDEFAKEKMAPYDVFNREMTIYEYVLPELTALLHEINDEDEIFVTAIRVDYARQALIFEDLCERGYIMANRIECLDVAHVKLILRKMAKMHATSAVLNERTQSSLECYDRGFFNRYTNNYSTFFVGMVNACAHYLSNLPEGVQYAKKLTALEPNYMEIGKACFAANAGQLNVFLHGDLWTNNVMFRYEDGVPVDVLFIDFQYSFWGSPTLDLHYFFNTSLKEDLRLYAQDALVQYYFKYFAVTLKKLAYRMHPVPSLRQFRIQMEEKRFMAFHSSCIIQPVMINEDSRDADFNALMETNERATNFRRRLYHNPRVQQNLKTLLPIFNRRGLLEIDQCL